MRRPSLRPGHKWVVSVRESIEEHHNGPAFDTLAHCYGAVEQWLNTDEKAYKIMVWIHGFVVVTLALLWVHPVYAGAATPTAANSPVAQRSDSQIAQQYQPKILRQQQDAAMLNTVVEIPANDDTFVTSNQPDANWGADPSLRLGYDAQQNGNGAERILLKFDVSGQVPAGAVINNAYIELYETSATPSGDASMGNIARHLNSDWQSAAVTWNSHEPNWGGVDEQGSIAAADGWRQMPVTGLVQEWLNGTQPNYGAILIGDETVQERERIFYSLNAANDLYPRIVVDYGVSTDTTPPYATVDQLSTYVDDDFNVTWSGSDSGGSGIAYYDVQYQIPGDGWQDWQLHTTATSANFAGGQNGVTYQFRARAVDNAGNVQEYGDVQAQTTVDSQAPSVTVNPLPQYSFSPAFTISWSGTDNGGSGIAYYDVQYKIVGGSWQDWLKKTSATSAQFTGAHDGLTYRFRARGVDYVGNAQSLGDHQAETTVELNGPVSDVLPFAEDLIHTDSFAVSWNGQAEPGKTILYYDVYYRFNDGAWEPWLLQTQNTTEVFTASQGDGVYAFEARATDDYGTVEALSGQAQATLGVDAVAPFLKPIVWLPFIAR